MNEPPPATPVTAPAAAHPAVGAGSERAGGHVGGRRARLLMTAAIAVLCPVAAIGAALSFQSLHQAAAPVFGPLALGFPFLVDLLILGATLAFLAGAIVGRPRTGWRWTAHGGVIGTLLLNALAAQEPASIAWHITPALVWSVLVELSARQVLGAKSPNAGATEAIPVRLWLSSPGEALRTWLQMARTGQRCHRQARADLAVRAAATQALRTAMPRRRQRGARRLIHRQVRAGALDPLVLLEHLRGEGHDLLEPLAAVIIHAFLNEDPAHRSGGNHSGPHSDERSPSPNPDASREHPPAVTPPERPAPTTGHDSSVRSTRSSQDRHQRLQVVADILRTRPELSSPRLARELGARGWPVSVRTARRLLAEAGQTRG